MVSHPVNSSHFRDGNVIVKTHVRQHLLQNLHVKCAALTQVVSDCLFADTSSGMQELSDIGSLPRNKLLVHHIRNSHLRIAATQRHTILKS